MKFIIVENIISFLMLSSRGNGVLRMTETKSDQKTEDSKALKIDDYLSFKSVGRSLEIDDLPDEFSIMQGFLSRRFTPDIAKRLCEKSGTHLIKLVSPRVDGEHSVLRVDRLDANRRSTILPSTNAPDIPFCKVVYRPLEVTGHASMSVVDHILNPEDHSETVLASFSAIFGEDVLTAMQDVLHSPASVPLKLGAGEFPIIFIPRPGGGDLQITPVSPATTFIGMKRVTDKYFQKTQPDGPRPPRGRWTRQAVSSKPQNISGAIGGPRVRLMATMPAAMLMGDAELYRYIHGGSFPRWVDDEVSVWVLRYADMMDADMRFNNTDTRSALDRTADRLIRDAVRFIEETFLDAADIAKRHDVESEKMPKPPSAAQVLIRRRWKTDTQYGQARKVLTSPHFEDRVHKSRAKVELRA